MFGPTAKHKCHQINDELRNKPFIIIVDLKYNMIRENEVSEIQFYDNL